MKEPSLLQSIKDFANERASAICSPDKPYFQSLVDIFEKKLFDDHIQQIVDEENERRVRPCLLDYCATTAEIPFPFTVDGENVNRIRINPEYQVSMQVSKDGNRWYYLGGNDSVRLFNALDEAGLLSFDE